MGDPDNSFKMKVRADKCKKRGSRDGCQEVREGIVLLKRGNARGGKALKARSILERKRCETNRVSDTNGNEIEENSLAVVTRPAKGV